MAPSDQIAVDLATAPDIAQIVEVLREGAAWMAMKDCPPWSAATLTASFVAPLVARSEFLVARQGWTVLGVCTLSRADPHFWPDDPPGEGAYLHKLAVRRAFAARAVTPLLVARCEALARSWGRQALRLDCHPMIRSIYERLGFTYVDTCEVSSNIGDPMIVDRLERRV